MTDEQYTTIEQQMKAGVGPAETYTFLKQAYPEMRLVMKDIYNARDKIKLQNLGGRSRIQTLMDELENAKDEKNNEKWNFESRKNKETGELTGLFFSLIDSTRLWYQYSDVIHIDATYKVNRFNVPLLSIVGTIGLNTTFYIANIFLVGKLTQDYVWAIRLLEKLAKACKISPKVIFIDKEDALASAIALVFPEARQFYCVFHINACVLHKVKKVYEEEDDQNSFINDWKAVI